MNTLLPANAIPKFKNQLLIPPVYKPTIVVDPNTGKVLSHNYVISIREFRQQLLPKKFPQTTVWGYSGTVIDPLSGSTINNFFSSPGPTFQAERNVPINVQWINAIKTPHPLPVDPTLCWADPNGLGMVLPQSVPPFPPGLPKAQMPVPIVTHIHGGENSSIFDGHPDAWFTADEKKVGSAFITSVYNYPNKQPSATLWYHDHAMGITRLNVLMGLAGFYIIKDRKNKLDYSESILPSKKYDIPIVIQDRSFNKDGSFNFPTKGINPNIHPYWMPEFFGNTIMVNGRVWPNLNVEKRQYRFRLLNGSNARFYKLKLSNNMPFMQIASDGGYLAHAVKLNSLTLAPGERADILIDFSNEHSKSKIILKNYANAPYPMGDPPDPNTTGQIMQFTITNSHSETPNKLPKTLNKITKLKVDSKRRILVLFEVQGPNGPKEVLLNGQKWSALVSELPRIGSTEEWEFVNLTQDAHPMHLHLIQFQVYNRQAFKVKEYTNDWIALNGNPPLNHPTKRLSVKPYLIGNPINPDSNEEGWKDTVRANPGEVTRIKVRFAPQDIDPKLTSPGKNFYSFNPEIGPGYVWHCHILDHEDNEMMRPYKIIL
ncbi:multicopper oxidase [Clostridium sp. JS66]|uniref:multicopper oxidase family protein n=1 Tax=Clostridium sp. JS66 TaxID=3064705 RepID=UPI00298DB609|nr:multicopper oxidase [Clostridium sp. JS66]WPC39325.1 multicopper oxidase [Clostridium sp. JS66]